MPGSLVIAPDRQEARFSLSEQGSQLPVVCKGPLPDDLSPAKPMEVVVEGRLEDSWYAARRQADHPLRQQVLRPEKRADGNRRICGAGRPCDDGGRATLLADRNDLRGLCGLCGDRRRAEPAGGAPSGAPGSPGRGRGWHGLGRSSSGGARGARGPHGRDPCAGLCAGEQGLSLRIRDGILRSAAAVALQPVGAVGRTGRIAAGLGLVRGGAGGHLPLHLPPRPASARELRELAFGMQMAYLGFLLAIMVFAADPMAPSLVPGAKGEGLSPLLQHPAMLIHPPIVFLGYAAWGIPFALAAAALISGRLDNAWLQQARPWSLFAWATLGGGILLGRRVGLRTTRLGRLLGLGPRGKRLADALADRHGLDPRTDDLAARRRSRRRPCSWRSPRSACATSPPSSPAAGSSAACTPSASRPSAGCSSSGLPPLPWAARC